MLLDVALAATVLFAAAWLSAWCLGSASADVRRTIWRATFAGVAALPILLSFDPPQAAAPFVAGVAMPAVVGAATDTVTGVPWLIIVWAIGCAFVLGRLTVGLAEVWSWSREAVAGDEADFAPNVVIPVTWGVIRPQILLPETARTWSKEALDLVVRHEAAHVAGRDWMWQTFARVITAALWFHPLAWVADRRLRREAERAADDTVLASGANTADYADELVRVARTMVRVPPATTTAVGMVDRSTLEQRVRHVLDRNVGRGRTSLIVRVTIVAIAAALSASAAAMQQRSVADVIEDDHASAAPHAGQVFQATDPQITPPVALENARPAYPEEAMKAGVQGTVVVEAVIDELGRPSQARVIEPLEPSLDHASVEAAMRWRFAPGRINDEPVAVRVQLEFSFAIK